ncbi:MAG TPA: hypothetical protein ENI68_10520 [Gammaproteobacteria bacterium]|nr:hypothetical protein [Gammaproteobacteria bacterium]
MEIKSTSSSHERSVQASRQSDRRDEERKADFARRERTQKEQDRRVAQSAGQANEARFFAIEDRKEVPVDSRQQVRAMRERVRQTYSEQENSAVRDAIHEQQARSAEAEQRAQRHDGHQPIDLIA